MNRAPPSVSPTAIAWPAPVRRLTGLALLAAGLGFTGMLSFVHVLLELFD